MNDPQWQILLDVVAGKQLDPLPVGFYFDSTWLPGWAGMSVINYISNDRHWLDANTRLVETFPDVLFIPGFWAEYGMCTEPAAFGVTCVWLEEGFPFPKKRFADVSELLRVEKPDCRTEGFCPFAIARYQRCRHAIQGRGHKIRFAVSRGPMNLATFLLGQTEAILALKTDPEAMHRFLRIITEYLIDWLRYQVEVSPTIDGLLILDDMIGFLGEKDFREFVLPYFSQIAGCLDVRVKAIHNDCEGLITGRHLRQMGFNLYNFSFNHSISEMRQAAGEGVVLLGNIPPRDVLAFGTPEPVQRAVGDSLIGLDDRRWLILSCGGGMPQGVPTANIHAFCEAGRKHGGY